VDRNGENLTLVASYNYDTYPFYFWRWLEVIKEIRWSPDGKYLLYRTGWPVDSDQLWVVKSDGTGLLNIESAREGYIEEIADLRWSPDSGKILYGYSGPDENGDRSTRLILSDVCGNKIQIGLPNNLTVERGGARWVSSTQLLLPLVDGIWLVDVNGNNSSVKISDITYDIYSFDAIPDKGLFSFIQKEGDRWSVKIGDAPSNFKTIYSSAPTQDLYIGYLRWSLDGSKLVFVDYAYEGVDEGNYKEYLIIYDVKTNERKAFPFSDSGYSFAAPFFGWLPDNIFLIGEGNGGIFLLNSDTGEKEYLPIGGSFYGPSPLWKYMTYTQAPDPTSICYGRGYQDLWTMSSLLNLTADLRATKGTDSLILNGIAADFNFEGYKIDYADVKNPSVWNPISPPSDVPVLNDLFTTWIPPYEGRFYVRLTAWDKGGNVAQDEKRVSWGQSASITNIYKSLEIFSPNGDGVKDTVELHYTVMEPVHLEFNIYDQNNGLIKIFRRDYTGFKDDYIIWDGRDESGQVVGDGKYKIRIFDYEFFGEVDNTPPDVDISLSAIADLCEYGLNGDLGSCSTSARMNGHAVDNRIKKWIIEYGEGENPQEWFEFMKGEEDLIVMRDEGDTIKIFAENEIEWLVGRKIRITAEDYAGNKSSAISNLLEERIILESWDGAFVGARNPADLFRPGIHSLEALETVRLPIVTLNVQYRQGKEWIDTTPVRDPSSGMLHIDWDNSTLVMPEGSAVRIKAIDTLGQEHYSNELLMESLFKIVGKCGSTPPIEARNNLYEKLKLMKFEVQIPQGAGYSQWIAYLDLDSQRGDSIPVGKFIPPLPSSQFGTNYRIRMTGITMNGEIYESTMDYPPICLSISLDIRREKADCGLAPGMAVLDTRIGGLNDRIAL
jgi:hypothetical protein